MTSRKRRRGASVLSTDINVVNAATTNIGTSATSHNINLPTDRVVGNYLIAMICYGASGVMATNTLAGFNDLWSDDINLKGFIGWREIDGTEGDTVAATTTNSVRATAVVYQVEGAIGTPEIATASLGTGPDALDPPNIIPSWGTDDFLAIAGALYRKADLTFSAFSYADDQYNLNNVNGGTTAGSIVVSTERQVAASSENPPSMSTGGNTARLAYTIAVREG